MRRALLAAVSLILFGALLGAPAPEARQRPPGVRLNRLASLLDEDRAAFGIVVNFNGVGNAPLDAVAHSENRDIDFVVYDLEHNPFDVTEMRIYMQFLLEPGTIASEGSLSAGKTVVARIPAAGREIEANGWMVKNVLDAGVHGIVFPHIETAAQALAAVRAMRYPPRSGAPDFEPGGIRGSAPMMAARYWGLSVPEYIERADIWRLDSGGNLIPWLLIESKSGVDNVREIARQLEAMGIGAVLWAGTGDMAASYDNDSQAVARAANAVLAAGKEFGLPVALNGSANVRERMEQGARVFVGGATPAARKEAGR